MTPAGRMRAARSRLGLDQRTLADMSGLSLPPIQRMEARGGVIRGNVASLVKLPDALSAAAVGLIAENAHSHAGGRSVRRKRPA